MMPKTADMYFQCHFHYNSRCWFNQSLLCMFSHTSNTHSVHVPLTISWTIIPINFPGIVYISI